MSPPLRPDELYFRSMDELFRRMDDRMWVAKGKPKLWVTVYDSNEVTVWVEVAYGGIKLRTPEGTNEGERTASIGKVRVDYARGKIQMAFSQGPSSPITLRGQLSSRTDSV